ncbi:Chitin synthase [Aspergillus sp. HF37]|nr:Chitin synthase [Aspergillus sp. HF37]
MASHVAVDHHQPLSSPPPVYLPTSPPPPSRPPPKIPANTPVVRRPLPPVDSVPGSQPVIQTPVKIDDAAMGLPQASTARIEKPHDASESPPIPEFSKVSLDDPPQPPPQITNTEFPPRRDSQVASLHRLSYGHTPASSGSWSPAENQGGSQRLSKKSGSSFERDPPSGSHSSSRGSLDSMAQMSDGHEPLHYHHQVYQNPRPTNLAPGDNLNGSTGHLSTRLAGQRRPNSAYSSVSDLNAQGRNLSPFPSPYLLARSSSGNSTSSPDVRSLSFIDLLNAPYPQPGPAPVQLGNEQLRSSVGNNASLLSHKQTFNMYLANVQKTEDAAIQYEFAIFMVNAMMDMPANDPNDSTSSVNGGKEPGITRSRLQREAKSILQRLADRSYPFAQYYLADGYASGLFSKGKEDYGQAFSLFVAASKRGHVEACYRAALCYEFGWGTSTQAARAQKFYRQAASKNHPGALLRMAKACLAGDMGLGKRYREGITWMKRAAESSDTQYNSAPYELGVLHEMGYGDDVFCDPSYAAQLFTKSADLGHVEASYRLGDAYEHGRLNCPRDPALSIHFYTGAAQSGHPHAMMALCAWYLVGAEPVLERDEDEAYEWAKQAAEHGLVKAEYAVGYFTEMGIGCRRDPLEANVWYVKAAEQGHARATHRIAAIRAAAEGTTPEAAGARNPKKKFNDGEKSKTKRFGIF